MGLRLKKEVVPMLELENVLKETGLDADPNGVLAHLVDSSNKFEGDVTTLGTEVTGLKDSVTRLEKKNREVITTGNEGKSGLREELAAQRGQFDEREENLKRDHASEISKLGLETTKLQKEFKTTTTTLADLQKTSAATAVRLKDFEDGALVQEKYKELSKLDHPEINEGLGDVVFNQITPFMHKDATTGKFKVGSVKEGEFTALVADDGKAVDLSILMNDVAGKGVYVNKAYPGAFVQSKGKQAVLRDKGLPNKPENNQLLTGTSADQKRAEVNKRLGLKL